MHDPSPPTSRRETNSLPILIMVMAVLLLAATCQVAASGGRVPVYRVTTITQPGTYYLTQDNNAGVSPGTYSAMACLGSTTSATFSPSSENRYYLIVPHNGDYEGGYGKDSSGNQIPPCASSRQTTWAPATCP